MITRSRSNELAQIVHVAVGAVLTILLCSISAQPAVAEETAFAAAGGVPASSDALRFDSDDPRTANAAAECTKAVAGKLGIRGFGAILEALRNNDEAALKAALIAVQEEVTRKAWNNFVQIPICAVLVIELGIHPGQVGEGDFGDVSSNFVGEWHGTITQKNPPIPAYTVSVTITRGDIGSTVASGYYTGTSPCTFYWTALTADPTNLIVNEEVYSDNCFNDIEVTLKLLPNGTISYDFENGNGQGVLQRP